MSVCVRARARVVLLLHIHALRIVEQVVFIVAGSAFRSMLIPLRLLGTVVVTLTITAGSTVFMFLRILGLDGIYWFVPICAASLVVGLTVDYDVFIVSRMYALPRSLPELVRAQCRCSSPCVFAYLSSLAADSACAVMSIGSKAIRRRRQFCERLGHSRRQSPAPESSWPSLSRRCCSPTHTCDILRFYSCFVVGARSLLTYLYLLRQVLNQFGFVLVAASLVDTFLVRTLFVPALMFLAVESNWWPGAMPPPLHTSVHGKATVLNR